MSRIHPIDCVPVVLQSGLNRIESEKDLLFLGKENLQFLARFWKKRKEKFVAKMNEESSPLLREDYREEVEECGAKYNYLRSLAARAVSKPILFDREPFRRTDRVACFMSSPDRFVIGTIVHIFYDEDSGTGSFSIRIYDKNLLEKTYDLMYMPEGRSMFAVDEFNYYCSDHDYFRLVLEYSAPNLTPPELTRIERMVDALPSPDPFRNL